MAFKDSEAVAVGTSLLFADATGAGEDVALDITSLADDAGQISARHDLIVSDTFQDFEAIRVFAEFQNVATPTVERSIEVWAGWWPVAADAPANIGTTTATIAEAKLAGAFTLIGAARVTDAAADTIFTMAPKVIPIRGRYLTIVVFNRAGSALTADDAENFVKVWPWTRQYDA